MIFIIHIRTRSSSVADKPSNYYFFCLQDVFKVFLFSVCKYINSHSFLFYSLTLFVWASNTFIFLLIFIRLFFINGIKTMSP
jgi:hypothetical protein